MLDARKAERDGLWAEGCGRRKTQGAGGLVAGGFAKGVAVVVAAQEFAGGGVYGY
jgi:hypothetical protein